MKLISKDIVRYPLWEKYVRAFAFISTGLIDLFAIPFGYSCEIDMLWNVKMLRDRVRKNKTK